jgi:hypothetical protein
MPDLAHPSVHRLRELVQRGPVCAADQHPEDGWNQRLALWVTNRVGTMWCAYVFCALAVISLPAAILSGNVIVIVAWIAQTFFQLVLLPVIMVGQAVQTAHADARAEQDHLALTHTTELLASIDARLPDHSARGRLRPGSPPSFQPPGGIT